MSDPVESSVLGVFVDALVDGLVQSGIRHFCVCPGSRSTPLALTVAHHPLARIWMHVDERSAAFFALGLAKVRREPVALICTSGTAAANFFPAVVEAYYARVPLVVLTADRPHELRDCGAPQTIDQNRLYGAHVKWFVDLPEPSEDSALVRYVRAVAGRAVATARHGPAGPVHLNCPYREPLVVPNRLDVTPGKGDTELRAHFSVVPGVPAPRSDAVAALADELLTVERGLIVCGPLDDPALAEPLTRLATVLGYPILADPLSGVRCGKHDRSLVLDCYDGFLRDRAFVERFVPDVVLRFGAMPTSKAVLLYLQEHPCRQILVDGDAGWHDPTLLVTDVIHLDARLFCIALAEALDGRCTGSRRPATETPWRSSWLTANERARQAVARFLEETDEPFEGRVFAEMAQLLPDGANLYVGNSMPVRDLDTFFPTSGRSIRFLANRGANGIDGVVSSALGASAGTDGPLVLAIGDLSFYHDLNGLLSARLHRLRATVVLLNNDGGGIFSFLPQADQPEHFETLFGTPHGLDFQGAVAMYGGHFQRVRTWDAFRTAIRASLDSPGLEVVEVPTDRARNVALHRAAWRAIATSLADGLNA